jgi:hypothetical protein
LIWPDVDDKRDGSGPLVDRYHECIRTDARATVDLAGQEIRAQRVLGRVPTAAIRRIAEWVIAWQMNDEHGPMWPGRISYEQQLVGNSETINLTGTRESWCYGAPGIARSLWLAGHAMNEPDWCQVAVKAYNASYSRTQAVGMLEAPTFCHGLAGLLQMTNEMYRDTGVTELRLALSIWTRPT